MQEKENDQSANQRANKIREKRDNMEQKVTYLLLIFEVSQCLPKISVTSQFSE